MRMRQFFINTTRQMPAEAELISHQLMLRAGLIRKIAAGIYTWMPLGLRVLRKVEQIVRQEMQHIGALEISMPMVQPAELWQESARWTQYGKELLRLTDRHERAFCLGPTHEEIITDIARREIHSYKQLPVTFFQIQTKFRDEIRPRFGVMRSREFLMKDAYSFHVDHASLAETYQQMYDAYHKIFTRLGLNFRAVLADTGTIGGSTSHEFQVLAEAGEDTVVFSDQSRYAANLEFAQALPPTALQDASGEALEIIDTPGQRTITAISDYLKLPVTKTVKTLIVKGRHVPLVALILRGDHQLNPFKAQKLPEVADPLTFADAADILAALNCEIGSLGPLGLTIPVIVDDSAAVITDFCCGANCIDKHYINVNWGRDLALPATADLRFVVEQDASPDGQGQLKFARGIEVGHIFQLGTKYSQVLNATVTDTEGQAVAMPMGCYGIGISRIVGAAIEQHHDVEGIIWPAAMAPFSVVIIPINGHKCANVMAICEQLYAALSHANVEVLLDDRAERPGVMFADAELIGIPHQIIVGERMLAQQQVEYQSRRLKEKQTVLLTDIINFIQQQMLKETFL